VCIGLFDGLSRVAVRHCVGGPSCSYFDKIATIAAPGYVASMEDLLKSRVRTSGIVEEAYRIDGVDFV
jgi:hypothetical protein